jgi:hypothetical protein
MRRLILAVWLIPAMISTGLAQTTLNPDISLIGNVRAFSHNDAGRPTESEEFNLSSPDMELMVAGYLNPYSRADAVIAWEDGENANIEELYATILRGLPLNMNLRVGKYRLEFGRLNTVHPHAYSFINVPLPHEEFFGEEGLNDMAVRGAFLIPTGKLYTELMGAVLKGDALQSEDEEEPGDEEELTEEANTQETRVKPGFLGRLTTSLATSDNGEFTTGASVVTSEYDADEQLRAWVYGWDMKYKWRPNRNTSLTVEAELLGNHRELTGNGTVDSYGGYGYVDYRFRQKYNVGSIYEYTQGKLDSNSRTWRAGAFVGFAPIEETSLVRLVGDWTEPPEGDGFWTATLQLVFSLGPHQPHNF